MVASARVRRVVAVEESPARKATDPNTREYVRAWLQDIGGAVAAQAEALEQKLHDNGYASKSSLVGLDDVAEVMTDLDVPRGVAKQLVAQAEVFAALPAAQRTLDLGDEQASKEPWTGFEGKLVVEEDGRALEMPKSRQAVDTYIEQVGYHASAYDGSVTSVISHLVADICMSDGDFNSLCLKLDTWQSMQLAAVVASGLPPMVARFVKQEAPMGSGGLEIIRALYGPYSQPMGKEAIERRSSMMKNPVPIVHKADLMHAILQYEECYNELHEEDQLPSEHDQEQGLMKLISKFDMAAEIAEERAVKRAQRGKWDSTALKDFLKEKAKAWVYLPKVQMKAKAKVAAGQERCLSWLHH